MTFTSFSFLSLLAAVVLLANAFPSPRSRQAIGLVASLVFLVSHVTTALQLLPLGGFLLLGYVSVEVARRVRSSLKLPLLVGAVVAAFVLLKRYSFVAGFPVLPFPYLLVGLSYILFRVIHLTVDAHQGESKERIGFLNFVDYCLNFLTFTAGPIQRYQDFAAARTAPLKLDEGQVQAALGRIVKGFVKVGVVSAALSYLFASLSGRLLAPSPSSLPQLIALYALAASAYTGHLYANFAGYMDIVVGVGALIGLPLPENFNRPFAARSFLDFWSRWHMTLSNWFKTYLFNPLLKSLTIRFDSAAVSPYLAVLAFFVTFLVMGVWHGATSVFVVYGLLLGAGASINKTWQLLISKRLGKKRYKELGERPLAVYLARGATTAYFALALTCLWLEMPELLALLSQLGVSGVAAGYGLVTLGAACSFRLVDAVATQASRLRDRLAPTAPHPMAHSFLLAAQVLLVVSVGSFFHKAPEFVYRAF